VPSKRKSYFIDANVFVYAATHPPVENDDVIQLQAGSQAIVQSLAAGQMNGVTSLTVLQEILYLLARWARQRQKPELYEAGQQIVRSVTLLVDEVLAPTVLEFSQVVEEFGPNKDLNDLLIIRTMQMRGITNIITADRAFESMGVTRHDPRTWI